jgi:hypothetical protein
MISSNYPIDVIDSICDPIKLKPYKKAQVVNCNGDHSFSLKIATQLFGKVGEDNRCEKIGPCPLCRGRVTSYHSNTALQGLVDSLLGVHKGEQHVKAMCENSQKTQNGI